MKFCHSIFLLFFFVFLLPTFVNAGLNECLAGGGCHYYDDVEFYREIDGTGLKKCADEICYAFKCIGPDGKIMDGRGCYEDFRGACSSLSGEILEKAKGEKEYQYYDENVIVISCVDDVVLGSGCADSELFKHMAMPIVVQTFGKNHTKLSGSKQCTYTTEPYKELASNSNDVKLSGIVILGFIIFYLW
uniref:Uncharacterized protein n=1 Tax=Panagrolaimus davidi TaxID=227884 RepID=A0A914Q9Y3_9BILA